MGTLCFGGCFKGLKKNSGGLSIEVANDTAHHLFCYEMDIRMLNVNASALSNMHSTTRLASAEPPVLVFIRQVLNPAIVVLTLLICAMLYQQTFLNRYVNLSVLAFIVSAWMLGSVDLTIGGDFRAWWSIARRQLVRWAGTVAILLLLAFVTKTSAQFSRRVILTWFVATPMLLLLGTALARVLVRRSSISGTLLRTHVVVGANALGCELATRLRRNSSLGTFIGFFDDRNRERLPAECHGHLLGRLQQLPDYVRRNAIDVVHIAMPMIAQPRFQCLLDELRDTTASIYFVPDILSCDLIQSRVVEVGGMPLVAIRESPFCGIDGVVKRCSDFLLSLLMLLLSAPLMLAIAIAIKSNSPGTVIFRQRRYGLNGEEILIYKFRTMTVCEDGAHIVQAQRDDVRITRVGRLLRKTSLDELPQLFNVLFGTMSMVGPRPHAVAHNEAYRRLIPGYMLRHKIRPGITGWAQVNGLRGETDTVDKMRQRVDYDLDYLRGWSIWLDLRILVRTLWVVIGDRHAY